VIDFGWLWDTWKQARWDALVLIWESIITDVIRYPWFALVLAVLVGGMGWKGVLRLARHVGGTYWSSHH